MESGIQWEVPKFFFDWSESDTLPPRSEVSEVHLKFDHPNTYLFSLNNRT